MTLWHVCDGRQFARYLAAGGILPTVRAWKSLAGAERFSRQTGRRIIIRLDVKGGWVPLGGHQDQAMSAEHFVAIPEGAKP